MFGIYARNVLSTQMFEGTETKALEPIKRTFGAREGGKSKMGEALANAGLMQIPNGYDNLCGECKAASSFVKLATFPSKNYPYSKNFGPRWVCTKCKAHVGCHKNTVVSLGTTAGPETSAARRHLHGSFDEMWRDKHMTRGQAYQWLRKVMHLSPDDCHIAMFTKEQCEKASRKVFEFKMQKGWE